MSCYDEPPIVIVNLDYLMSKGSISTYGTLSLPQDIKEKKKRFVEILKELEKFKDPESFFSEECEKLQEEYLILYKELLGYG